MAAIKFDISYFIAVFKQNVAESSHTIDLRHYLQNILAVLDIFLGLAGTNVQVKVRWQTLFHRGNLINKPTVV